jgi:superfamily II DNA or RNA helicase
MSPPPITLRPYQIECYSAVRDSYRKGYKRVLVSAPTGTGKTIVFSAIGKGVLDRGKKCLVLVNTEELVEQTVDKFARIGVPAGIVKARMNEWDEQLVVASIQTISRPSRLAEIPVTEFAMIIIDECHYSMAATYQRVMEYFQGTYMLGLSATLFRGDRVSLAKAGWQHISHVYTIKEAIRDNYLVPPVAYRIETKLDLSNVKLVKTKDGRKDFDEEELAKAINTVERNDTIVDAWIARGQNRQSIAFCCDVQHAFDLANAFRKRGIDARAIWGDMKMDLRKATLDDHKARKFPIITNCAVLTHGYDDPGIGCVLMCRPTGSKVLAVQCVGRGLRICPEYDKKDCLILDFVDMSTRHKLVTTADVAELKAELSAGPQKKVEEVEVGAIGTIEEEKERAKEGQKKKVFSNEEGSEEWTAQRRELLDGDGKQKAPFVDVKPDWKMEPASEKQRWWMYGLLMRQYGWTAEGAKKVAFNEGLKKVGVRQIVHLVAKGRLKEDNVPGMG